MWERHPPTGCTCAGCTCEISEGQVGRRCWGCASPYHGQCTKPPAIHRGPWHCAACLQQYRRAGVRDVALDVELMEHLATGCLAEDVEVLTRCSRAARFLLLDDEGRLWSRGKEDTWVEVPPIGSRLAIVRKAHAACGYADGRRLLELMRSRYFWQGMARDCVATANASLTA